MEKPVRDALAEADLMDQQVLTIRSVLALGRQIREETYQPPAYAHHPNCQRVRSSSPHATCTCFPLRVR